jgi:hypothetical protein
LSRGRCRRRKPAVTNVAFTAPIADAEHELRQES